MSLFPLPAKVEERLDKLRRDFLWSGNKEGKKIHLVKWQTALLSKKTGGLGIKNLRVQNKSLLSKWLWRFVVEDQALWRRAILNKYGQTEEWVSNVVDSTYGVSVWRSIRNLWDSLKENLVVKVGEGNKIFFWKDKWIGQECLNSVFPDLFSFCTNPEAKIAEIWSPQGWNLTFRRNLNDWEVDRIAELLLKLGEFTGPTTEADGIRWKHNSDGKLSVRRLYKREIMAHSGGILGPWKQIWKGNIPTKVKCFTWLVIRRACLTQEKLKKRGFQIVSRCFFCHEKEETNSHLFLHCRVTVQVWHMVLSISQEPWVMPEHTADLLSCWMRRGGSKTQKRWWSIVPTCVWWAIWRERNLRCHENITNSIQKVKENCINMLFFWCKEDGIEEVEQLVDFLGSM